MKTTFALFLACATALSVRAAVQTQTVEYKQGDTTLEGSLAYDDANSKPRPGVLVVHDWTGVQDYAKSRAKQRAPAKIARDWAP